MPEVLGLLVKFYMMVSGNTLSAHLDFLERLKGRLNLHEVYSVEQSDVIIAFVAIRSRAGTDIDAALQELPETAQPVVLVVLHHTYDPYIIIPESRLSVNRSNVFTVDCLFHEDQGLLRCQRNDEALKAVTDHLISKGVSVSSTLLPDGTGPCLSLNRNILIFTAILAIFLVVVIAVLAHFLSTHPGHKLNGTHYGSQGHVQQNVK